MLNYCLKPSAKKQIKDFFIGLSIIVGALSFCIGFIAFPFVLLNTGVNDNFEIYSAYIGILSWTIVLSLIAIVFKRWLQSNIIEC